MKEEYFADYQTEFLRLKEKYKEVIELYFGLEVDYINNYSGARNEFFRGKFFDYLIGSVHYLDKMPNDGFWCSIEKVVFLL